jgi:putative Holliday junction resolvase
MKKMLAIDFGLSFMGLATNFDSSVEPLATIKVKSLKHTIDRLVSICQTHQIEHLVMGLPEGKIKNTVLGFGKKLEKQTGLKLSFQAEDFTSKQAWQKMIEAGKPQQKRKKDSHSVAACLILQDYLDNIN